jgi:His-Xaa-Ser system protein HxsD
VEHVPVVAWRLDTAHLAIPVDVSIFSIEAVIRSAYKLTDRCFTFVEKSSARDTETTVYLVGRSKSADLSALALEFRNELVDQQLRCQLEAQFKDVRTLITAQAFSEGNLVDVEADEGDYREDPLKAGANR